MNLDSDFAEYGEDSPQAVRSGAVMPERTTSPPPTTLTILGTDSRRALAR